MENIIEVNLKNSFSYDGVLDFVDEPELASLSHESEWLMCDCGHDCCPCNSQCK